MLERRHSSAQGAFARRVCGHVMVSSLPLKKTIVCGDVSPSPRKIRLLLGLR